MTTTIAPGEWLADGPAADYLAALDAGCPNGCVTDAGRTHDEQEALFLARYTPRATGLGRYGDARWYRGTRYVRTSSEGSVAIPDSPQARHQTGQSLDLREPARSWMTEHGPSFGWIAGIVAAEKWHFEHPSLDRVTPTPVAPQTPAARPVDPWEEPMNLHDLVVDCYINIIGRVPTGNEAAEWVVRSVRNGWTPQQVVKAFEDQKSGGMR